MAFAAGNFQHPKIAMIVFKHHLRAFGRPLRNGEKRSRRQNADHQFDERYNHGGMVADYIVNELDRKVMGFIGVTRWRGIDFGRGGDLRPEGHGRE